MAKTETETMTLEGTADAPREAPAAGSNPVATRGRRKGDDAPEASQAVALAQMYTPPELLQLAIIKKSDIAVIERMAALAERWQEAFEKREARKAFINAMVDAKLEMPTIVKNRNVKFKSKDPSKADTDYWHEDLAAVVEAAQPILAKNGLTFRWRTQQPNPGQVTITCILEHRGGHAEENELTAAVDTSGNKNHIQAIKSVATYLERITALASVGLAARGQDDDGKAGGLKPTPDGFPGDFVTSDQITALVDECKRVGCSRERFLAWAEVATYEEIRADQFDGCMAGLATFKKGPAK
jgi:hypothetical protein